MRELCNFYQLNDAEQKALISPSGLDLGNQDTWTYSNCLAFKTLYPDYEVSFEFTEKLSTGKTILDNIIIFPKAYYYNKSIPGYDDDSYSKLIAKVENIPSVSLEQPIFLRDYSGIFSECKAKSIIVPDWDLSSAEMVFELFKNNTYVEEIDMSNWTYPNRYQNNNLRYFSFDNMFAGCKNLRILRIKIPNQLFKCGTYVPFFFNCFKDCINIEEVYFCEGSSAEGVEICKDQIKEVSTKTVIFH